jgi:hypothetical protein
MLMTVHAQFFKRSFERCLYSNMLLCDTSGYRTIPYSLVPDKVILIFLVQISSWNHYAQKIISLISSPQQDIFELVSEPADYVRGARESNRDLLAKCLWREVTGF